MPADFKQAKIERPLKIHDERLRLPARVLAATHALKVTVIVEASLGEDGFPWPVKIVKGEAEYVDAARGAVSLWRYRPTRADNCPVPTVMTVTVQFSIE